MATEEKKRLGSFNSLSEAEKLVFAKKYQLCFRLCSLAMSNEDQESIKNYIAVKWFNNDTGFCYNCHDYIRSITQNANIADANLDEGKRRYEESFNNNSAIIELEKKYEALKTKESEYENQLKDAQKQYDKAQKALGSEKASLDKANKDFKIKQKTKKIKERIKKILKWSAIILGGFAIIGCGPAISVVGFSVGVVATFITSLSMAAFCGLAFFGIFAYDKYFSKDGQAKRKADQKAKKEQFKAGADKNKQANDSYKKNEAETSKLVGSVSTLESNIKAVKKDMLETDAQIKKNKENFNREKDTLSAYRQDGKVYNEINDRLAEMDGRCIEKISKNDITITDYNYLKDWMRVAKIKMLRDYMSGNINDDNYENKINIICGKVDDMINLNSVIEKPDVDMTSLLNQSDNSHEENDNEL